MPANLYSMVISGFILAVIMGNLMFLAWRYIPEENAPKSSLYIELPSSKNKDSNNNDNKNNNNNNDKFNDYNIYNDIINTPLNKSSITIENRKLRRPYRHDCDRPVGFPGGPPRTKRLIRICSELDAFSVKCNLEKQSCKDCIPPWGGESWAIETAQKFKAREEETRQKRRKELQHIIDTQMNLLHDESSILLITLNYGYNYLFLNWLCGLEMLGIASNIRESTLIIATDEESERLAHKLNFPVVRGDWLKFKIDKQAARKFALGAHKWTVALQIVYTYDIIEMGYNVIQQDVDVVWLKDVRSFFDNSYLDIEMVCDGRLDRIGPGNTGFIRIRSNCKTKIYMETLIYYIGLVLRGRSDQRVWNMFLMSYDFRQILFEMLPPDKFVGGHQWGNGKRKGHQLSNDIWFLHASWTSSHNEKISKFKMLDAFFLNETCPYYNKDIVPTHEEPKYYISPKSRNWVFPDPNQKKWW